MTTHPDPVIGILGGMGPAATADFYTKLVALTPVATDQDHPKVVIWADPTIPDRTLALTEGGPDPTPWLLHGATILRSAGATMLAIPCNTAHAFLPAVSSQLGLPVVHMVDEVAKHIVTARPQVRTVGLLATSGTIRAQLYQQWLGEAGISVVTPGEPVQSSHVMPAIRAVKAGRRDETVAQQLTTAARHLFERGAQVIVAGCTEIPLGLPLGQAPCPVIDPATVLAQALLDRVEPTEPRATDGHLTAVAV
jgi:aspartate racemase